MSKVTVTLCDVCGNHIPGGDIPDGHIVTFYMSGWPCVPREPRQPSECFHGAFDVTVCCDCFRESRRILDAVRAWRANRKDSNLQDIIVRPAQPKLPAGSDSPE
jgi:hypothetical protein